MKNLFVAIILLSLIALVGCQSTLDKNAALQNDVNVQQVTLENDESNTAAVGRGEMTDTTKSIKDERNHKARRLARSMARDAGNEELPAIPTLIEEEPKPEPVEPE